MTHDTLLLSFAPDLSTSPLSAVWPLMKLITPLGGFGSPKMGSIIYLIRDIIGGSVHILDQSSIGRF